MDLAIHVREWGVVTLPADLRKQHSFVDADVLFAGAASPNEHGA